MTRYVRSENPTQLTCRTVASRQYFLAACKLAICVSVSLGNVLVLGGGLSTGKAKSENKTIKMSHEKHMHQELSPAKV